MSDREYAVWVFDSHPGGGERIEPVGNRYWADKRVHHYERLNETRQMYGITAKVVFRYTFMPGMSWEDV